MGTISISRRFHESESSWLSSFALDSLKVLVVCRGPVRMEAFEIFDAMGIREYGMLLSEKDSVIYPRCLAPELRSFRFPGNIHRVPDYMGAGQEEKIERIREIVGIAKENAYSHVFAGYGFMAEDAEFVEALEGAGLGFLGPSSGVIRRAGAKDEAKKLARSLGNAVIPGVDNVSALALCERANDEGALLSLAREHSIDFSWDSASSPEENAESLLQKGYASGVEIVGIDALQSRAETECRKIWSDYPTHRIRFKHIGGGGGKGQRVVEKPEEIAPAVMDVLAESKALTPGSNRNFLIELNIERTRHNEIQLVGNGEWCISMGGRDCSVQMHEQKLLEVSLTRELLEAEVARSEGEARRKLEGDQETLARMESEGERFGEATALDSVSTFECIVDGFDHFFMEMNTRIQVEHGVTELVYALRFTNPEDPSESFVVDYLIELMALLALHGDRLPRPERICRAGSGVEVRINATNAALQPHAGGLIRGWSKPLEGEIRFDQGIGTRNPDTGSFVYYNLAGAYDSNVALILCRGDGRRENLEALAEILRAAELRGDDLQTNMGVHYGLVNWFLGRGAMAEPDTQFMVGYLAGVGAVARLIGDVDLDLAFGETLSRQPESRALVMQKETLLLRPLQNLLADPHGLAGFLGRFDGVLWEQDSGELVFRGNPLEFLQALYYYLNLEETDTKPPSEKIWQQDAELLQTALEFYADIEARTGLREFSEVDSLFEGPQDARVAGDDPELWQQCVAAHRGHQLGLELLLLIPRIGVRSGFLEITVDEGLGVCFPERFANAESAAELARALAPPPKASSDEIVTPMGGTFFAREAPHLPVMIEEGDHFEAGQPLFIIEVMKMFNKVLAPFAGTVIESLMEDSDGSVVSKGQRIFRIEPDERLEEESEAARTARVLETTRGLL